MSDGGWYPDPTGRFAQRYYDGTRWTEHVVGASGATTTDAMPVSAPSARPDANDSQDGSATGNSTPAAPPPPTIEQTGQPAGYGQGSPQQGSASWQPRPAQPWLASYTPRADRYAPGVGLAVGLAGMVCVALSLFALDWASSGSAHVGFLDFSSRARADGSTTSTPAALAVAFFAWAGFVLAGLALLTVLGACIPLAGASGGRSTWRIIGALVVGVGAGYQAWVIRYTFPGSVVGIGAWLGVIGFLLAAVAMVLGARRRRT